MPVAVILTALLGSTVVKHSIDVVRIGAEATRTVTVPFPDALEYGNARYAGRVVVLGAAGGAPGRRPRRTLVRILDAKPVLGGSEWQVRVRNRNPRGTAPVRLEVIATTTEPLPHR
jgi:hypothetical protein